MRESGEEKVCFPNILLRFRQRCNYEASELFEDTARWKWVNEIFKIYW